MLFSVYLVLTLVRIGSLLDASRFPDRRPKRIRSAVNLKSNDPILRADPSGVFRGSW